MQVRLLAVIGVANGRNWRRAVSGEIGGSELALRLVLTIIRKLIQEIGVFGQAFFPRCRELLLSGAIGFVCLWFLAACAGDPGESLQSGRVWPWGGSDGRWVGPVTPVDPGCGSRTTGLMSIGSSRFAFDPFQSTDVLQGLIDPTGQLGGEAVRPVPGNVSITMRFLGRVRHSEGTEAIIGTLTSGRCHWSVTLLRG